MVNVTVVQLAQGLPVVRDLALCEHHGARHQRLDDTESVCDEEVARVSGVSVRAMNLLVAVAAAITVGVTMRVVGILLVSGMLVLPVAAVQQLTRSFNATFVGSLALGLLVSVAGVVTSYYVDAPPGATIVMGAILAFVLASVFVRARAVV